jgi:serine/threonine protein kinase
MSAPTTSEEFLTIVRQSGLLDDTVLRQHFRKDSDLPEEPSACATALVRAGLLTPFQARHLLAGKFRGLCLGQYKVLNQLGKGGMGAVYLAEHTELHRLVALKMLPAAQAKDELAVERFKREARAAAALDHPNIVKVFDVFQSGGMHFMVMEYVAGKDLASLVKENGPLHFATAITYTLQAAAGLQHAHDKGFVHRDIKPANLILSKDGTIKLLDMGLTRSFEPRDQLTEQFDKGSVIGTAEFVSPEQAMSEPQDHRSDIYSLGATLYALITGTPPFSGHTTQLLMQHQFANPPRLSKKLKSTSPKGLNDVIGKMMAKHPQDRFQSADDVVEALEPYVSITPGGASETSLGLRADSVTKAESRARLQPRRRGHWARRRWVAIASGLVAVLAGIGGWLLTSGSSKPPVQQNNANTSPPTQPAQPSQPTPPAPEPQSDLRVQMANYDATIGTDGMMPSFRVNGVEALNSKVGISRGLYLWQDWVVLKLADVQRNGNVITAKSSAGTIRYEFGPNRLNVAITNATRNNMVVFVVVDATEAAMVDSLGQWNKLPFDGGKSGMSEQRWAKIDWFCGKAKLTLTGAASVWGPWSEHQVVEMVVPPGVTKSLAFEPGTPTEAEAAKAAAVIGKTVGHGLRLDIPKDYQVFQRRSRMTGAVTIRGRVEVDAGRVEARVTGMGPNGPLPGRWEALTLDPTSRSFAAEISTPPGGWYSFDIRASEGDKVVTEGTVGHVGVGEVFVIAGQSNSTNCGEEKQKQTSGMISTFSGQSWQLAADPQPGVHDNSRGGSPWMAFGDALYARFKVPIGIASTGQAGSSLTQWQTDGELFRWSVQRMKQLDRNGFRAVLWHQGEADVAMDTDEYTRRLTELIRSSRQSIGWNAPWFVAQVSYHSPAKPSFPAVRAAQKKVCDIGLAIAGPDSDALVGDNREDGGKGIHFSGTGLRAHGQAWAEKVGDHLDAVMSD